MDMTFITPSERIDCPKLWKNFDAQGVSKAELTITGLGMYRAFLNGQRVGTDYLTPGFNDYDAYLRTQTYDVTALIADSNRLEVWLGEGWYMGRFGLENGGNVNHWGDRYLLAARLTLIGADGEVRVIDTDESWLAARSAILSSGIYDGEQRDDTRDEGKPVRCVTSEADYSLEPQTSPPIRARMVLKPTLIITPKGEQVLEFGQNMAGIFRFRCRAKKGDTVYIRTGEVLQEDCFYRDNLRSARSEYTYVSDGQEKMVEPYFTFFGFRYLCVEGIDDVSPEDFEAVALCSDLRETLECETDNLLLNQLMQNALWGQRSNFLDVPTDCPQRDERLGWTADTQVFVDNACYQMDCKEFYRKFIRDMRIDQTRYYSGDIPMYCPSLKGEAGHGGAVWADAGTIIPWKLYMNYGDVELLRESYPLMRDYVETLIAADVAAGNSHIVYDSFTFGDWLAQDGLTPQSVRGGTEEAFIQGVYAMNSYALTGKAARVLDISDDAEKYEALADEVHAALIDEYVTPGGRLAVDTQTAYVLALYYGVYRDRDKLLTGFRRRLKRDFYRITCGFTGAPLMLPVLFQNGMVDEANRMLLTERFPGWLYCVKLGATTIWERWNSLEADGSISGTGMNSLNHYAFGSVCGAVYSHIMGLECAAPGWTAVRVAPKVNGRIRHSRIRFDSPAGVYEVSWDIGRGGSMTLSAVLPDGATAEIVLPHHPDGLTETVVGGTHTYTWQLTKDLLHPFSADSIVTDLLENEAACEVLRVNAPDLFAALSAKGSEAPAYTLRDAAQSMWLYDAAQMRMLDERLRKVER